MKVEMNYVRKSWSMRAKEYFNFPTKYMKSVSAMLEFYEWARYRFDHFTGK